MEVGRIIGGKYRLEHEIGEGAMGSVWAGVHEVLGRRAAIKFMRPALEDATTAAARFVAEAKAAAQLKHRFIVDVFDFGITDDGQYYMVQELLDGEPLAQVLDQGPAWPVEDVVRFAVQCLSGLAAVHANGVVHRDLKPENIFVMRDADGRFPKLLDFGISKAESGGVERSTARNLKRPSLRAAGSGRMRHLTAVGATLGTPAYMSPEQLRNQSDLDGRADLYSLGVVLYEWLSGRCPYESTSDFGKLYQQIRERSMTPLERLRPELGPALCQVVARALAFDAKDRFANAAEMRETLLLCSAPSHALSIVQSPAKTQARMGQKTQVLLESASDPFADPDEARFLPRFPSGRVLVAGAIALGLALTVWLSSGAAPSRVVPKGEVAVATPKGLPKTAAVSPPAPLPVQAARRAAQPLPIGNQTSLQDLPIGADMPDEDLPSLPFANPLRHAASAREQSKGSARSDAHEKRRERATRAQVAMQPTDAPREAAQNAGATSSPSPDRPIRQKVVRQLDF